MYLMKPKAIPQCIGITDWDDVNSEDVLKIIEKRGRLCYKSEDKTTDESYKSFVKARIETKHVSIMDHVYATVRFISDRGASHQFLRQRLTDQDSVGFEIDNWIPKNVTQESTRYVNYMKRGNVCFIIPNWANNLNEGYVDVTCIPKEMPDVEKLFLTSCLISEVYYNNLIADYGLKPEDARGSLGMWCKTEYDITANLSEWRLIFERRTGKECHPQMRELTRPLLKMFKDKIPIVFDDINSDWSD